MSDAIPHPLLRANVRNEVSACRACALCNVGSGPIPFRGPSPSRIAVIGEAPGRMEDATKKPFVGPSGLLATGALDRAGVDPGTVAWLNVVSCYPNRTPTKREVDACQPNLMAQLRLIQPSACILFGGVAVKAWWPDIRLGDIRGKFWRADVQGMEERPWMMATWHPSAVLRNGGLDTTRGKEFTADLARFRGLFAVEGLGYVATFRYAANLSCITCGEMAEHWVGHDGKVDDSVLGAIGYCPKHWAWIKGETGGGKKVPVKPRRVPKGVVVQEGLL